MSPAECRDHSEKNKNDCGPPTNFLSSQSKKQDPCSRKETTQGNRAIDKPRQDVTLMLHRVFTPNVPDQRPRTTAVRIATQTRSRGSLYPAGSAYVPYKLNAITVPAQEEINAPTADSPNIAVIRFEADI